MMHAEIDDCKEELNLNLLCIEMNQLSVDVENNQLLMLRLIVAQK
jgi:hypothetical protein